MVSTPTGADKLFALPPDEVTTNVLLQQVFWFFGGETINLALRFSGYNVAVSFEPVQVHTL
jgi:hypothetical protein